MTSCIPTIASVKNCIHDGVLRCECDICSYFNGLQETGLFSAKACFPTGSGKSLCYALLPAAFDSLRTSERSIVIVVSPLTALMKDQVQSLERRGVRAAYLHSGTDGDAHSMHSGVCAGEYQLLFMSPETLLRDKGWRDILLSQFIRRTW